jgi:hypothetical protein
MASSDHDPSPFGSQKKENQQALVRHPDTIMSVTDFSEMHLSRYF